MKPPPGTHRKKLIDEDEDGIVQFVEWIEEVSWDADMDRVCKWLVEEETEEIKEEPNISKVLTYKLK